MLEEQAADAQALFEEYNNEATRPDDFSDELLADLDAAWFDL
jgi:hypothetical protein